MSRVTKSAVALIDELEAEKPLTPYDDLYMLPIPMKTYKALSDAAAKRNLTFSQLLGKAIDLALED